MKFETFCEKIENSIVLTKGKTFTGVKGYFLKPFGDYRVEFAVEKEKDNSINDLHIYLYSEKFASFMNMLFNDSAGKYQNESIADGYLPRKLRADTNGCLGFAMPSIEYKSKKISFENACETVSLETLLTSLDNINNPNDVFNNLFYKELSSLIFPIEGFWVCAYLWLEQKKSLSSLLNDNDLKVGLPRFLFKKPVTQPLITHIEDVYNNL